MDILQDDQRYKNVEDAREREDLFRDFCLELEKKEKEDRRKQREAALDFFQKALQERLAAGGLSWRSVWADSKKDFVDLLCRPELKGLDDADLRRSFQDFAAQLEEQHRKEEKRRKEELQKQIESRQAALTALLEHLGKNGLILPETRWKDFSLLPELTGSKAYTDLMAMYLPLGDASNAAMVAGGEAAAVSSCRDIFEKVLQRIQDTSRSDKRLLRDVMQDSKIKVAHDSSFEWFRMVLLRLCKDYGRDATPMVDREVLEKELEAAVAAVAAAKASDGRKEEDKGGDEVIEEGEEVDDNPAPRLGGPATFRPAIASSILSSSYNSVSQLRKLVLERNASLVSELRPAE